MRWGHDFGSFAGVLVAAFCALAFLGYAGAVAWAGLRQARAFGTVCLHFLLGAIAGAACTPRFGNLALLVPALLLMLVLALIYRGLRRRGPSADT